ncbi:MAG TPA: acetylglutamate kinase [Prevotella sp.]
MKEKLTIIKVGGAVVEDEQQLNELLTSFVAVTGGKVLVHGGGRRATKVAAALGIESRMVNGRRITDKAMLDVVTMVYGGLVNKGLVARLQAKGVNALGLTGADMNVVLSHKRPPKEGVDFGFVGDVDRADGAALNHLIQQGIVPVMASLTHDGCGHILNTNADTIASEIAKALAPYYEVNLVYCFEKKGVLVGENEDNVIPELTYEAFKAHVESGVIAGGMIPKLENAFAAIRTGVSKVMITHASAIDGRHGTIIR